MPRQLCINGHRWESLDGSVGGSCPVCGSTSRSQVPLVEVTPLGASDVQAVHSANSPDTVHMAVEVLPTVPGFEVLEEAGRGGMGIVYKAREITLDRIVALKVIRVERRGNDEIIGRFRREFEAASRLSHPNVVSVYSYSQVGDTHFLSMEFVPGNTLQKLVEEKGPLEVPLACEVVRQAALGLQHITEMRLVHRDIKPGNLMLQLPPAGAGQSKTGPGRGRPLVKILDMGVARLYQLKEQGHHGESLTTLTRDGVVLGTPDYIAPEQLENPHGIDIRADLYSLGCVFYFLLTGVVPFPGTNLIQKLDKHRWHAPLSVEQVRNSVPRPVAAVVRRLMAKHPDDRYETPAALAAALEQLQRTGELPLAHQPEPLKLVQTFTGHTRPVVGCAFLGTGSQIISAGGERVVLRWERDTGKITQRLSEASADITSLCVVPNRDQLLVGQGVSVRLYDLATGKEVRRLMGHSDAVRAMAVSRDGKLALTGGDDRTVRLWDLTSGREMRRLAGHRGRIGGVAVSPDGRFGVSGDRDQNIRLWDLLAGRELRTFPVPRGAILGVSWSPDGRSIATAHYDTTVRLWEVDTGRELRRFTGHRQMVAAVAFSPDGTRIASAGSDRAVLIWDVSSGAELSSGTGHTDAIVAVAFAPDGTQVLTASTDRTVRLWAVP
jgi:WD40 repeat protein